MQVIQNIRLDINDTYRRVTVSVKQADSGRLERVRIVDGNSLVVVPASATVTLRVLKPDGTSIYNPCTVNDDGTVDVPLSTQATAVAGRSKADVSIAHDGYVVSTANFTLKVETVPVGTDVVSSNEFTQLNALIGSASQYETRIGDLEDEVGDLSELTTTAKTDLVSAINEAAESGGSNVPTNVRQAIYTLLTNAAYAETGLTDEIAVVESWATEVTELTLSASTLSLNGSTPQSIPATVVPSGSTVSWSSSDTSVATVVGGVVTGVSNGTCTITASAGDLSATCNVTVSGFAVLESISAVYTQSGTVYDTDSLDDLKTDLVVTATYSDSSTATVPSADYVLSGTLEVGTSTITVSYGGKTAIFTVTVTLDREAIFGTFVDGHCWVKTLSSTGVIPKNGVFVNSTSARAAAEHPIANNDYTITVTDSSKYNVAVYDITDDTAISATSSSTVYGVYYTGGTKSIGWASSDSASTSYIGISLKKMDGTSFTAAELANGAEAVFTFTTA